MEPSSLEIRQIESLTEFSDVVALQQEIWGFHDIELLPRRLFVVASKIGGQVLGGFDGEKMVAFCLCIPGLKPGGKFYLHGHMLGVLPEYRNSGLGRMLKWKQREYASENGVALIEWTFDPLEIKNAFFNIERLGAIVRRYVHNQYGMTSSHLHGGLPTDRLVAEWWIYTPRVKHASDNRPVEPDQVLERIVVPIEIAEIRQHDGDRARQIQADIAAKFERHFREGLAVIGFERSPQSGTYLLGKWESE